MHTLKKKIASLFFLKFKCNWASYVNLATNFNGTARMEKWLDSSAGRRLWKVKSHEALHGNFIHFIIRSSRSLPKDKDGFIKKIRWFSSDSKYCCVRPHFLSLPHLCLVSPDPINILPVASVQEPVTRLYPAEVQGKENVSSAFPVRKNGSKWVFHMLGWVYLRRSLAAKPFLKISLTSICFSYVTSHLEIGVWALV